MKKTVRIFAVVMVVIMLGLTLASCGGALSGKYTADYFGTGIAMTFSGSDVTIAITVAGAEVAAVDAGYSVDNNMISFDFGDEEAVDNALAKTFLATLESPVPFVEGDGYITIAGIKYAKAAD